MSRWRFAALLVALGAVAAAASFAAGVALLDDPGPDEPPGRAAASDGPAEDTGSATTPSSGITSTTAPLGDGDAAWIAVVSSEGEEASAAAVAEQVGDAGLPAGVLRSDDHESLTPGFWVAYAGPYPSAAEAEAATAALADKGWTGAYTRCVGTQDQCS